MEEDVVKQVFKMYLESIGKKTKIRPKTASGPDFIVEGNAYECKGSKFDEKGLLTQVLQYAFQFSRVGLVLPYDAITFELIWKLEAIEYFIRESPGLERSIEIFLVAEAGDQKYAIYNFSSAGSLNLKIGEILYNLSPKFISISSIDEKEGKILEFLENIETEIREEIKKYIVSKAKEAKSAWDGGIFPLHIE
jgi:hypothetical protein